MCFGSSPKPPDPIQTAQAQQGINRDALVTAAQLNQINQTNPFGSVSYSGEIGSPNRTQTTTLTPETQRLLDTQVASSNRLGELAFDRLWNAPSGNFSLDNAPDVRRAGDAEFLTSFGQGPAVQTGFEKGPALATSIEADPLTKSFDPGGTVQRSVSLAGQPQLRSDFDNLVAESRNAQYAKNTQMLDPQFAQEEQATRARLAAQGITEGSDAFNREIDNFSRRKQAAYDDARNSSILSGDQLQNTLFGQSLAGRQQGVSEQFGLGNFSNDALAQQFGMNQAGAQFANQAQQQGFNQNQARTQLFNEAAMQDFARNQAMADFANNASGQIYDRNRGAAQFTNDALADQFRAGIDLQQADSAFRDQSIQENILGRNQQINEGMAFLNGTPIAPQNPTFQPFAQSTAAQAAPDMVGLAANNYSAAQQARAGMLGSIFGSVGQIGAAAASCWVAREVYGVQNPKWLKFRAWMFRDSPAWFARQYLKHGERVAKWIKDKPLVKALIRMWMDTRIAHAA